MKSKKELKNDIYELAKTKIPPAPLHLEISLRKGEELAEIYHANKDIVFISICFMDIALSEAMKEGKAKEHTSRASKFAKEYLKDYDLTEEEYLKIINSIEAHHGEIPCSCIEAEVCANADCYRFISSEGVFTFIGVMAKRTDDLKKQIKEVKYKLDEKYQILSLDKAKEELEE